MRERSWFWNVRNYEDRSVPFNDFYFIVTTWVDSIFVIETSSNSSRFMILSEVDIRTVPFNGVLTNTLVRKLFLMSLYFLIEYVYPNIYSRIWIFIFITINNRYILMYLLLNWFASQNSDMITPLLTKKETHHDKDPDHRSE